MTLKSNKQHGSKLQTKTSTLEPGALMLARVRLKAELYQHGFGDLQAKIHLKLSCMLLKSELLSYIEVTYSITVSKAQCS